MDNKESISYKDTLNLPKTAFPMKAELPVREPKKVKEWDKQSVYRAIIEKRRNSGKKFILHDGPPYANGHIHMGHVLNKILKDICVKYQSMQGCYVPYVPGWDCHGLPVEHQLFKELNMTKADIGQVEFRKKAYKYAMKFVKIQSDEFKRLGIFGDWENPYLTLTKGYEADILFSLGELYEKGYIYKGLKPVNWCKTCETALAEAEVEYEDKISPSIYVKFRSGEEMRGKKVVLIVWTTTPWTLLANVAVALHPHFKYSYVDVGEEIWVMQSELAVGILEKMKIHSAGTVKTATGQEIVFDLKNVRHPFLERDSVLVLAEYVTSEDGSGCVHIAPGHGQDDYFTGKKYNLPVLVPVNHSGRFTKETGEFNGMDVFKANTVIISKMRDNNSLLLSQDITHSYPHCWRCKEPIIFRATEQWFMSIDHADLRKKMMQTVKNDVKWIPASGAERIGSMVENRPDWCLSRQRYWGVPIPAFTCQSCGMSFSNAEIIKKVAERARERGADVWFEEPAGTFLPHGTKCAKCGSDNFKKEEDILDVWFDSGVSHQAVLKARSELSFPADLYLEGSDQHRGWFQAALITSMGIDGRAPYKKVLTHGFVVDGEGKKMSKSVGNVISPEDIMKDFGADILRLWVASSDYEGDIKLSSEILARLADGYRKIRNTYKYLLSNLYDFDPAKDIVPYARMAEQDRWILSRLEKLADDAKASYEQWEFHKVYRAVYDFCVYEVSAFYLDVSKDILYIFSPDSLTRRSAQTAIFHILNVLVRVMAPILAFTSDEVWAHMPMANKDMSVHMTDWPGEKEGMSGWRNELLDEKWSKILGIRDQVMKFIESRRESGDIGSSLEVKLSFYSENGTTKEFISGNIEILPLLFRVSQAEVVDVPYDGMETSEKYGLKIGIRKADGEKCPRCWNYSVTVGANGRFGELCERCRKVMLERSL